jgi:hypothetical protein
VALELVAFQGFIAAAIWPAQATATVNSGEKTTAPITE